MRNSARYCVPTVRDGECAQNLYGYVQHHRNTLAKLKQFLSIHNIIHIYNHQIPIYNK